MTPTTTPARLAAVYQERILLYRQLGRPFSERNVLLLLSELVLSGADIHPDFQALANAVMAKAIIDWKLPNKKAGKPKGAGVAYDPLVVTEQYFDFLDRGNNIGDSEIELATRYGLSDKQIRRIVEDNNWLFGNSKAARDQRRADPEYKGMDELKSDEKSIGLAHLEEDVAMRKLNTIIHGT